MVKKDEKKIDEDFLSMNDDSLDSGVVDRYVKISNRSNNLSNPQPPAKAGFVHPCIFCGEDAGSGKFCKTCRTADGRKKIFEENQIVLKELRAKGYCQGPVNLMVA